MGGGAGVGGGAAGETDGVRAVVLGVAEFGGDRGGDGAGGEAESIAVAAVCVGGVFVLAAVLGAVRVPLLR
jgi:hypothetical protein